MPKTKLIAGVVLKDNHGRYLMVQERKVLAKGLWSFTGGHVDEGETLQAAAIREALEETGFEVELLEQEPILVTQMQNVDRTYHAFLGTVKSGTLTVDDNDLLDAQWLTLEQITELHTQNKLREPLIMEAIVKAEHYAHTRH